MMNANDAFSKTKKQLDNIMSEKLADIENTINLAILNGKFETTINTYLDDDVTHTLEVLGYLVIRRDTPTESWTSISWKSVSGVVTPNNVRGEIR